MKRTLPIALLALLGAHFGALAAPPAKPAPAAKSKPAEPPQQDVALADLARYVGKHVTVHTKLNTTRSGTLTKASAFELDLKVDTGADITIPTDSVKRVTVPVAPPDPLFQTPAQKPGDGSAKKN